MPEDPFYKAHWREIEPERLSAYRGAFGWDAVTEALFEPAAIGPGQQVLDFGCGPGKVTAELARRVGAAGHVHALDINSDFLATTRETAAGAGLADRVTTHLNDGVSLPLADAAHDRVTARNALMYVDDPVHTLREFHRILRPGGIAHAIDGDWFMMVAEPVAHDDWRAFVKAASHACRNADMGRKLRRCFHAAGFEDIRVSIVAKADVDGGKLAMIRNMGNYACRCGPAEAAQADRVVARMEAALADGDYLVVSPQFVVTGRRAGGAGA